MAVVDIGTNTLKFSVTDVDSDGSESIVDAHADTVRLGAGIESSGAIAPDRIERALASLKSYERHARDLDAATFIGVATAAMRMASNGAVLLDRIAFDTSWDVKVISGAEEALLAFNGLVALLPDAGDVLVADIGGGSTELIMVKDRVLLASESIAIGSGTLADRCFAHDPPGLKAVRLAVEHAAGRLQRSTVVSCGAGSALYLSGGNGQFLRDYATWDKVAIPFAPHRFDDLVESISGKESAAIARFLGIAEERARMLPAGAAIARAIVGIARPGSTVAVPSGIRGGLVAEWLAAHPIRRD